MSNYNNKLLECKFRGISFPIQDLETQIDHDLVEHKYPDRDGAHIESMGRNPIKVSAKALFYNNISKGTGESWTYGDLFPNTYLRFIDAIKDKSVAELQHPILGTFDAKVISTKTSLEAGRRDGVTVDVSWIETIKFENFNTKEKKFNLNSEAKALDDQLSADKQFIISKGEKVPNNLSFSSFVDSIRAVIDTSILTGQRALSTIDRALYHINNLFASVIRINSVLLANLKSKIEALKSSLISTKQTLNVKFNSTSIFIAPKDTTLSALAAGLKNSIVDIIKLNSNLASKPIIVRGTAIRYYKVA